MKERQIKQKVKERYGKIALVGSSSVGCCAPAECCDGDTSISPFQIAKSVGYNINELDLSLETLFLE